MNDFRTRLTLEGSDFNQTLNDAQQEVNKFKKSTEDASDSVNDMNNATKRSASELLKQMKTMEGLGRSTSNYRKQLGEMTREIQDLSINYAKMSYEMKNSDFGREVARQIQDMTKQAAEYRDAIQDATQSTRLLASDTSNLDAAKSAIQGLSAGMQLFASMGILGEKNTEKVIKALAKLKAIESATNAVITIANVLNKDSILMLKIKEIQTRAATKAQIANTTATKGATIAQRAFNTVAKSNPYILLATVILTVVAAMVSFTKSTNEARREEEEFKRATDKARESAKQFGDTLSKSYSDQIATFVKLQEQWKSLTTEMEKTEFIKNAKSEFEKLGLSINNISDAEKVLEGNTENMYRIFKIRALAAAYGKAAMDAYNEAIAFETEHNLTEQGQIIQRPQHQNGLYGEYDQENDMWTYTAEGARKANEEFHKIIGVTDDINKNFEKGNVYTKNQVALEKELQDELKKLGLSSSTDTNNNNNNNNNLAKTFDKGSIADYDAAIQELNNALKNRNLTEQETLDIMKEIVKLEQQRAKLVEKQDNAKIMASPIPTLNPISTKKALEDAFKKDPVKIPAKLYFDEKQYTFLDLNNGISDAISGFGQLNSAVSSVDNAISSMAQGWDENKTAIGNVTSQIGNMLTIMQSVCTVIETMNKLSAIFDNLQLIGFNLEQQKNTEKKKGIILTMAESYQQARATGLSVVEAIATAIKSASEIPMVGWAIGLAAAASVIALLASAPKFAKGGIVPGSSFSGDKITAQVNSGEMILNRRQQAKLFDMLDSNSSVVNGSGGRVEFVIKGQELKGVLNNYDKKMSRI